MLAGDMATDRLGNPVDPNSRLGPGDTVTFGGQTWHSDGIGGGYISYNIFRPVAPFGGGGDLSEGVREDTSSKRACKKVSGLLSNPAVREMMNYTDTERLRTGKEWAFFAGHVPSGRVGMTPLFGGENERKLYTPTVNWAYNLAVYGSYLEPAMLYHSHLGNAPPSPVGNGDASTAVRLGLVVVARDKAGNITCTDGKR